jgi:hypothetical protein
VVAAGWTGCGGVKRPKPPFDLDALISLCDLDRVIDDMTDLVDDVDLTELVQDTSEQIEGRILGLTDDVADPEDWLAETFEGLDMSDLSLLAKEFWKPKG